MRDEPEADELKPPREAARLMRFAGLILDLDAFSLARESGGTIALTRAEFALLRFFVSHPGRVLSRDALLEAMAGRRFEPFDRSVDVVVGRLRRKIEPDPKQPCIIVTVPGGGYRFDAAPRRTMPTAAPEPEEAAAKAAPRAPERRHITALAVEMLPAEGQDLPTDPEDLRAVVDAFRHTAAEALAPYGSTISESRRREIVAYFGYPLAQENDAERAVRAGLAIQRALSELNVNNAAKGAPGLSARIGVDSGSVLVDATGEVFGDAPNVAARVQALAEPGAIVVTGAVQRQTAGLFVAEDRGAYELKGMPEPVTLYRIVRASGGRRAGALARGRSPLSSGARRSLNSCIGAGSGRAMARGSSRSSSANPASASRVSWRSFARRWARRRTLMSNGPPRSCCRIPRCTRSPNGAASASSRMRQPNSASPISRALCS
jgi:class 3 adenylate cyclase